MSIEILKRASIIGALFFCVPVWAGENSSCQATGLSQPHEVAHVFDGDTLRLGNGTKVRLIGINTPETAKPDRPGSEPYADEALETLKRLIQQSGGQVRLIRGKSPYDRYGRLLAHVYTSEHANLSALLLRQGLGHTIAIPPNLTFLECYQGSELAARQQARGIWRNQEQTVLPVTRLSRNTTGFRHVRGKITRIGRGPTNIWLNFDRYLAIRIPRSDLEHFKGSPPEAMIGKTVEARGWIYRKKSQLRVLVRHPAMIHVTD